MNKHVLINSNNKFYLKNAKLISKMNPAFVVCMCEKEMKLNIDLYVHLKLMLDPT